MCSVKQVQNILASMQPHHVLLVLTVLITAHRAYAGARHALPSDPIEVTVNPPTPPQTPATALSSEQTVTSPLSSSRPVTTIFATSSLAVTTEDIVTTAEPTNTTEDLTTHHDDSSPALSPTSAAVQTTTPPIVSTNCSSSSLSPASPDEEKQLVVTFPPSAVGHSANCTWILPALDNNTSNVFSFHTTYDPPACNGTQPKDYLGLYDVFQNLPIRLLIADSCSGPGWKSADTAGYPTTIQYLSANVTSTTVVLGTYSSSSRPKQMCGNGSQPFVANSTASVFTFPGDGLRIPNLVECTWIFRAPDPQGVINVQISNHNSDIQKVWCSNNLSNKRLSVWDTSYSEAGNYISMDLCPDPVNVTYQSFGNQLSIVLSLVSYGGAAPLSIQYSSMGPEVHCPVQSPREITVARNPLGNSNFIMGMNRVGDHGQPQTCTWKLVAPDGMVIRFNHLYSKDYNSSAGSDTLQFDSGDTISMRDTDTFPVWSDNSTSLVQFHTHPGSRGKRFVIGYMAVPKDQCQGHPVWLDTPWEERKVAVPGMYPNDTSGNSDCRWIFRTNGTGIEYHVFNFLIHVSIIWMYVTSRVHPAGPPPVLFAWQIF